MNAGWCFSAAKCPWLTSDQRRERLTGVRKAPALTNGLPPAWHLGITAGGDDGELPRLGAVAAYGFFALPVSRPPVVAPVLEALICPP
jgi:hypothetical protein